MASLQWSILKRCVSAPHKTVFVDDSGSWSRAKLLVAAMNIASEIEARSSTQTVGVMMPTSGASAACLLACWLLGRTAVPLNFLLKPEELQFVVDDCDTDIVLTSKKLTALYPAPRAKSVACLEDLPLKRLPDPRVPSFRGGSDLAALLYTSGTSGRPKGVMLSHDNLLCNVRQSMKHARFTQGDVLLGVLPQFHAFGLTVLSILPMHCGNKVVYAARFEPRKIVSLMKSQGVTAFIGIPSMYGALLKLRNVAPGDLRTLRYAVSGAEPLPHDISQRFQERFGVVINEGYGLTETSPVTNMCQPWAYKRHSVGPALPDLDLKIVRHEGSRVGKYAGVEEEGEVRFRGPNVMQGYYKRPDLTAEVFDERGYFRTGDIGKVCADGHLYITGRIKEMMIVGGENVFPREIEEVLNRHPMVHASGVIGVPDSTRGEVPMAFVELEEGEAPDNRELRGWCRENLAGYKVPKSVHFIERLPRNPTGKIMRRELHGMVPAEQGSSA